MLKLALRVLLLTAALGVASLVFVDEEIVSALILTTITLTAGMLIWGRESASEPSGS